MVNRERAEGFMQFVLDKVENDYKKYGHDHFEYTIIDENLYNALIKIKADEKLKNMFSQKFNINTKIKYDLNKNFKIPRGVFRIEIKKKDV